MKNYLLTVLIVGIAHATYGMEDQISIVPQTPGSPDEQPPPWERSTCSTCYSPQGYVSDCLSPISSTKTELSSDILACNIKSLGLDRGIKHLTRAIKKSSKSEKYTAGDIDFGVRALNTLIANKIRKASIIRLRKLRLEYRNLLYLAKALEHSPAQQDILITLKQGQKLILDGLAEWEARISTRDCCTGSENTIDLEGISSLSLTSGDERSPFEAMSSPLFTFLARQRLTIDECLAGISHTGNRIAPRTNSPLTESSSSSDTESSDGSE